jgi:hypothetical protein
MTKINEFDTFVWLGKPNSFHQPGPRERTEFVRKMGKGTVAAFIKAAQKHPAFKGRNPVTTLRTLVGRRLIDIPGYKGRATVAEVEELQRALYAIVEEQQPMTVRQVFYQATVHGLVEKTESGYDKVQRILADMRREDELPWEWIVDNTRGRNHPLTFENVAEALEYIARRYRKELWNDTDAYVEIWLEKDALAGVIEDITRKYDVSLMVARGYSSLTFLHDAAEELELKSCPIYIYHLGDFDPSGVNAGENIEEFFQEYAPTADITFTRLAVTEEQIEEWDLPTRPTKRSDTRAARFGSAISVELDAIEPRQLRSLVENAIKKHLPPSKYKKLMAQEEQERKQIRGIIEDITDELEEPEEDE